MKLIEAQRRIEKLAYIPFSEYLSPSQVQDAMMKINKGRTGQLLELTIGLNLSNTTLELHNLILPLNHIRRTNLIQLSVSKVWQNLCFNNVLLRQKRVVLNSRLNIRKVQFREILEFHIDIHFILQLKSTFPFLGLALLSEAPLGFLPSCAGPVLIISPDLPHSGLLVFNNCHQTTSFLSVVP